ncbi:MAG: MaoC domain protein dehydratase [Bacteroidetes bacterium]|nr:MaoC domain protein dehydratase [Bacteroidota bacterium]
MIEVNQVYTHEFKFSQEEVNQFAQVTGDKNPVHLDADYAAKTMFKRPIGGNTDQGQEYRQRVHQRRGHRS